MANYNRGIKLPGEILNQQEIRSLLATCNRGPSGARAAPCFLPRMSPNYSRQSITRAKA
jgi:hypothetical protein